MSTRRTPGGFQRPFCVFSFFSFFSFYFVQFNCSFLMPLLDKYPARLREDLGGGLFFFPRILKYFFSFFSVFCTVQLLLPDAALG